MQDAAPEPRLIAVVELSDWQSGELAERIEVDISDGPICDADLRVIANNNWDSEIVGKLLELFALRRRRRDAAESPREQAQVERLLPRAKGGHRLVRAQGHRPGLKWGRSGSNRQP